jgi:hypothetical protein
MPQVESSRSSPRAGRPTESAASRIPACFAPVQLPTWQVLRRGHGPASRPFGNQAPGDLDPSLLSCHSDGMPEMPRWEQRLRAPQLMSWSLLGRPVSWAERESDRGVVLATVTGRTEVFAFDAKTEPAELTQITDRPLGTSGAAVSPDGSTVFWFDDRAGDELGGWRSVAKAGEATLLPELSPAYAGGIVALADGRVAVGRLIDVARGGDVAFEVAVAGRDGTGSVVYQSADPAELIAVAGDGSLALLGFPYPQEFRDEVRCRPGIFRS